MFVKLMDNYIDYVWINDDTFTNNDATRIF